MSIQHFGYAGVGLASLVTTTVTENIGIAVLLITLLVGLSTLMIRINLVMDNRIDSNLNRRMADGDLPTKLERLETQRTLEELTQQLGRLLEDR